MRNQLNICFSVVLCLALTSPCLSQQRMESKKSQFPLEFSFFNHAIAEPFTGVRLKPFHPGFSLGTEYGYTEGKLGRIFQDLHAGYYYNKYTAKALFIQTGLGYRYTFKFGLFGDVTAGAGYLHSFHPRQGYKRNSQGSYEKAANNGKPALTILVSLGIGYDFSQKTNWPVSLFFRYQPYLQTPYNPDSSIWPQSMVHFGLRIHLW